MEDILFWNNGLFRQPYWYIFLYSKLMVNHPDAGETNMTYDAAGNLLTKLTAELRKSISDKGYISYTYGFMRCFILKISSTVLLIPMVRLAISITVPVVLPSLRMRVAVKPITMADRVR